MLAAAGCDTEVRWLAGRASTASDLDVGWAKQGGVVVMGDVIGAPAERSVVTGRVSAERLYLAGSLILLNLVDVLLTRAVIDRGGVEANPLMSDLMQGLAAPLGLKTLVAATAGALLLLCPAEAKLGERAVAMVAGLYLAIVVWNAAVLGWLMFS